MPRFTVKQLLTATTLIAIGVGMIGLLPTILAAVFLLSAMTAQFD